MIIKSTEVDGLGPITLYQSECGSASCPVAVCLGHISEGALSLGIDGARAILALTEFGRSKGLEDKPVRVLEVADPERAAERVTKFLSELNLGEAAVVVCSSERAQAAVYLALNVVSGDDRDWH